MQRAFTLIELSVVLVIVGLLAGGIFAGRALIANSQLRAITQEHGRWITATQSFRDKYDALPGDMPNAISYWGAANNDPALCAATQGTGTQTCNGDGNDSIVGGAGSSNEIFRYWQHLANAGFIEGKYSGISGTGGSNVHQANQGNSPASKYPLAYWYVRNADVSDGETGGAVYYLRYSNNFLLGGLTADFGPRSSIFTGEEGWLIDTKTDDGMPGQGNIIARSNGTLSNCTTSADGYDFNGKYKIDVPSSRCAMYFRNAF